MNTPTTPPSALPQAFLARMSHYLAGEFDAFLASYSLPARIGLRVNTLKISPPDFLQRSPFHLSQVPWCPGGFTVQGAIDDGTLSAGRHPYHTAGLYYLQEPSAMAAAPVLAPQPGEAVIDLAAAPGGKATHLAALMNNSGLLVANEIHPKRVWDLVENLERSGVTNAIVTNETPQRLADHFGTFFDRVLVDAPCSGEGMFRKSEIARREWKPELVPSCSLRQLAILDHAARLVRPAGRLVYTTCTFAPEENEGVIVRFLAAHPDFELESIPPSPGFHPAVPEWTGLPPDHAVRQAVRIWPHTSQAEGHFIALLVRDDISPAPEKNAIQVDSRAASPKNKSLMTNHQVNIFGDFCHATLDFHPHASHLLLDGSYLYLREAIAPDLAGLKVIRPGWWLGIIEKGRFTPSHSLAMALNNTQARHALPLAIGDPRLDKYLGGESFPDVGVDGWVLITLEGYPLGWGKRVHNQLKNYYPRGLRRHS